MQLEAIYKNGQLEFIRPVQFKHDHVRIVVEVPDEEVVTQQGEENQIPDELKQQANELLDKLEAIRNPPISLGEELPELTEKQLERINAFALRDEIRSMR